MRRCLGLVQIALSLALVCVASTPSSFAQNLAQGFAAPPDDARPMVRWWWFGPAIEQDELAREIAAMRAGGFGGFEIQPVYPLSLEDQVAGIRNLQFLSDDFLNAVRFANDTARAEGLRVDVTLGSGWPFGGPHVPVAEASAQIRMIVSALPAGVGDASLPTLEAGERLVAVFLTEGAPSAPDAAAARSLPVAISAARVSVAPADRERTLLALVQSRTGQQVKRPALGGEGFVLDHMNAAAVRSHLDFVGERLLSAFGETPPYAVFSDSLEAYGSDWTDDLLVEFRRRRGYDLAPRLPALFFDVGPQTQSIRHDWGLTLTELVEERYLAVVESWAGAHQTRFRSQTYGSPPTTLSSNRLATLAEGEGANWRQFSTMRWASSANHLYGRPVTSAEAWTWLHSPSFRATPLDVKVEADALLLQGANQFIAHGWPYSPPGAGEPGWAFYAAAVFNDHNPWWPVMADVNAYLQRLSYLLRQGEPVADVAILLPTDDALARLTPGHASVTEQMRTAITDGLTQQILDAGYSFDYVDGPALEVEGFKHKVLVLPGVIRITPAVYRLIAAFANRGGIVIAIGQPPQLGGGLLRAAAEAREVRAISAALFSADAPNARVAEESALGAVLQTLTPADLVGAPPELGFVHRKVSDGDVYFLANTSNQSVRTRIAFREQSPAAQWWEPRTGKAYAWAPGEEIALAPYESRVFVFGQAASAPTVAARAVYPRPPAPVIDLSRGWRLVFTGSTLSRTVSAPYSWTQDAATRFFSGKAIYTRTVQLTANQLAGGPVVLSFGAGAPIDGPERRRGTIALLDAPVREAAEVFVNGQRVGSVWAPPFTISLEGFLQPGANRLELRVTNTAINAMAARNPPDYRLLNIRFGERFQAQDVSGLTPLPSGLLGPITLRSAAP